MTGPSVSLALALAGLAVIFFAAVLAVFGAAMPRAGELTSIQAESSLHGEL